MLLILLITAYRSSLPNGSHLITWTTYGEDEIPFSDPKGVAVDSDGNMYIVNGIP